MEERDAASLRELADLGLSLARNLAARAEAAPTGAEAERLALSFHRVSRSVRLSLALISRLASERRQGEREERVLFERRNERRKAQVRAALTRDIYDEAETDEAEALLDELEGLMEDEALHEAFAHDPLEAAIARIRKDLGLVAEPPANDPGADAPHAPAWPPPRAAAGDP